MSLRFASLTLHYSGDSIAFRSERIIQSLLRSPLENEDRSILGDLHGLRFVIYHLLKSTRQTKEEEKGRERQLLGYLLLPSSATSSRDPSASYALRDAYTWTGKDEYNQNAC